MKPYATSTLVLRILAVLLATPASTAPALRESLPAEPEAGLVVEAVRQGSTGHQAGIRPGDILLTWSRPPAPASPLWSPFDLYDVSIEELPRGPVALAGRRGNEEASWVLPGGSPSTVAEIQTRPVLPGEILALYEEGEGAWQRAAALALERGEADTAVWLRTRLAEAWMKAERWDEADSLYEEILKPLEEAGSPVAPHLLREWGGGALLGRRAFILARACFQRALALDRKVDSESLAVAEDLSGLGTVANLGGGPEDPEIHLKDALAIREKLAPGSSAVAASWHDLGFNAETSGIPETYALAVERYHRALEVQEEITPRSLYAAERLKALGLLQYRWAHFQSSEEFFERALSLVEPLAPEDSVTAVILQGLGMSKARQGRTAAAIDPLERALQLTVQKKPGGMEEADVTHDLGMVEHRLGRTGNAVRHACRAVEILETKRQRSRHNEEDELWWGFFYSELYRNCASTLVAALREEEAFLVLERGRSRLVHFMAERELRADLPPPLALERKRLAAQYDRVQAELAGAHSDYDLLLVEGRLREIRRWREKLLGRARVLREPPPDAKPLELAEARSALDPGTVLLAYSIGEEETLLFVIQPRGEGSITGLTVRKIRLGAAEMQARVDGFRTLLANPHSSEKRLKRQAEALYDLLLRPAELQLRKSRRALISADGPLHSLPFAALRRRGRYLMDWKPVHTILSATVYAEIRERRRPPEDPGKRSLVAFGAPHHPPPQGTGRADSYRRAAVAVKEGLPALPASRREVEAIARVFPRSRVFLGKEATEEAAKRIGKDVRLLHFAVHGLLDPRVAHHSALALSLPESPAAGRENGFLQVWEIGGSLNLDADLVTLSACRTGLGKAAGGEGLVGLTRAFQIAGARSVVATLWPVADASTADLMKRFYERLRLGAPKDRALQAAQQKLRRSGKTRHPFYWAGFQLYGDWW